MQNENVKCMETKKKKPTINTSNKDNKKIDKKYKRKMKIPTRGTN